MMIEIENFRIYLNQVTSMDDQSFNIAKPYFQVEKISKGDYLVTEGQKCNKIVYINEGLFRIFYLKDGIEINTCFCKEHSIISSFKSFQHITSYIGVSRETLSRIRSQIRG